MQPRLTFGVRATPVPPHIYFWRVQNNRGRWYTTWYRSSEEDMRAKHPEAERIDHDFIEIPDNIDPYNLMYRRD